MSKSLVVISPCLLETLKGARELLSVPSRWTKKAFARDAKGGIVTSASSEAASFCTYGALRHQRADYSTIQRCMNYLARAVDAKTGCRGQNVYNFNDDPRTTHADILEVFDEAIQRAKKDGA